ncbi:LURP-one-related 15 [Spatholobus suberectus]|nr:LURP-one-related 15 [Spatholobus suberectus]
MFYKLAYTQQKTLVSFNGTPPSPMANQVSVIDPHYCTPDSVNLQINTEKSVTYDVNGERVFYIKDTLFTLQDPVLCDGKGNPIVTLHKKNMTLHGRWQVFKGKSSDPSELLFSVKRSSMIQREMIKLEVFLANNTSESDCDFRVIVCRDKSSCTVYAGESPQIVAEMENNGGFNVLVYPNVDYAFIVALLMIINGMTDYAELAKFATEVGKAYGVADLGN